MACAALQRCNPSKSGNLEWHQAMRGIIWRVLITLLLLVSILLSSVVATRRVRLQLRMSMSSTLPTARQIFELWPGVWRISRQIVSPVQAENMTGINGYCSFLVSRDNPHVIKYSEKVMFAQGGGAQGEGTQRYEYRFDADTGSVSKHFKDGRLFYNLALAGGRVRADEPHLCVADTYTPEYLFRDDWQTFRLTYSVSGPAKAYTIITEFVKLGEAEAEGLGVDFSAN